MARILPTWKWAYSTNKATFIRALRECAAQGDLLRGKKIHATIYNSGLMCDVLLGNAVIHMYAKCGSPGDARETFSGMHKRNMVSWNILISAYAQGGQPESARRVFDAMPYHDVVSWNTVIMAYTRGGLSDKALELLWKMYSEGVEPNNATFVAVLDACADSAILEHGKEIHARIADCNNGSCLDIAVATTLVKMYGRCGCPDLARRIFNSVRTHDTVCWTAMISAYSQNGKPEEALALFELYDSGPLKPDHIAFASALDACANLSALARGKTIHAVISHGGFKSNNLSIENALIHMYWKCGSLKNARNVFDRMRQRDVMSWNIIISAYAQNRQLEDARSMFEIMPQRDVVSWNAMIAACAHNGHAREAFDLFSKMGREDIKPNKMTISSLLDASTCLVALTQGKIIHALIAQGGFESDIAVENALLSMYGNCGNPNYARRVFENMPHRDLVTWNGMIAAYALNGQGREALDLFQKMGFKGVKPDKVTFLTILSGCSHAGLSDHNGCSLVSMSIDHNIMPSVEHYVCVIDLLCRAGKMDEAENLINCMPFEYILLKSHSVAWTCLLAACRNHGDVERGAHVAQILFELESID